MKLARLVQFNDQWQAAYKAGKMPTNPPLWALASFQPDEKDEGKPSFYRTDEAVTAADVSAALAFRRAKIEPVVFVEAEESAIITAGFRPESIPGSTNHPAVNARHVEIEVKTATALSKLTRAFLKGEVHFFGKAEITKTMQSQARAGAIDWAGATKDGPSSVEKYLRDFVREGVVQIIGRPAPAALAAPTPGKKK